MAGRGDTRVSLTDRSSSAERAVSTMKATRRAKPGDEQLLADLNAFVHDLHLINDPGYFKPTVRGEVVAWFRRLLDEPTTRIWIAEVDGQPVGYVSTLRRERAETPFCRARRWLEIDQIGVHQDHRRRGIGRALVQLALDAAAADGLREVELASWVFNGGAHDTFRRLGFRAKVIRHVRSSS
jgi:diamine N-acetyltransferase